MKKSKNGIVEGYRTIRRNGRDFLEVDDDYFNGYREEYGRTGSITGPHIHSAPVGTPLREAFSERVWFSTTEAGQPRLFWLEEGGHPREYFVLAPPPIRSHLLPFEIKLRGKAKHRIHGQWVSIDPESKEEI